MLKRKWERRREDKSKEDKEGTVVADLTPLSEDKKEGWFPHLYLRISY